MVDSNYIKAKRVGKGIKQSEMASELGVSIGSYSKKENGITAFTDDEKIKVSGFLDFSEHDFLRAFFNDKKFPIR